MTDRMDAVRARLGLPWEPMQQCRELALTSPQAALDSVDRYDSPKERAGAALGVGVAAAETAPERVLAFVPDVDMAQVDEVARTLEGLVGGSEPELDTMRYGWRLSLADPALGVEWVEEVEPPLRTAALVGVTFGCAEVTGVRWHGQRVGVGSARDSNLLMNKARDLLDEEQKHLARSLPAEIFADLRLDQR